jgi:hypothetical protein
MLACECPIVHVFWAKDRAFATSELRVTSMGIKP